MTATKITDHVALALDRLVSQFDNAEDFRKLISASAASYQSMEDEFYRLITERWLPDAVGAQLDGMGEIVGEQRDGREDEAYRLAIQLRIFINNSEGTPGDVINFLRISTGASVVSYVEKYPAKLELFTNGATIPAGLIDDLHDISPVAIGLIIVAFASGVTPFGFEDAIGSLGFNGDGFDEGGEFSGVLYG